MREQRKYFRLRTNFTAIISIIGDQKKEDIAAQGINISIEGMMIISPIMLLPKTRINIKIKYTLIEINGTVVYMKPDVWHKKPKKYICGIHFTSISHKNKQKVADYIRKTLNKYDWRRWL